MNSILKEIEEEVLKAKSKLPEGFENENSRNDFIAYAIAYLGRASEKVFRNKDDPREMLVKAAGLIVSAIESGK